MKMNEKLKAFLDELTRQLNGLPEAERIEVLNYYEEYINDAVDEGVSPEELLSKLEAPINIAASIKAEISIRNMKNKPGLKNYSKVVKYTRIGIKRPLSIFLFSLLIFTTYSTAICLFIITIASAAAACIIFPTFVAEAIKIPSQYPADIIGTIAMGVFFAGLMMLVAWGLYSLCGLLFRSSAELIARMLNKKSKSTSDSVRVPSNDGSGDNLKNAGRKVKTSDLVLKVSLGIITIAFIVALVTGLPTKIFMLLNSMKPSNITLQQWEYSTDSVDKISINTVHSNIRITGGNSDKIEIQYEQSDWLEPEISSIGRQLTFNEKSNGRMPLFPLISIHENRAELVITLPNGYKTDEMNLESRGGFIYLTDIKVPTRVKTYSGSIYVEQDNDAVPVVLKVDTSTGVIKAYGKYAGTKTDGRTVYQSDSQNGTLIRIESTRGSIFIK